VAIIGGGGRMGAWFAGYFSSKGFSIVLSDIRTDEVRAVASDTGAEVARTNSDAVMGVDVALICVPIARVREVIVETAPYMKPGALLVEVSSIKACTMESLRKLADRGIKPLSIHPLFGPSVGSLRGNTVAVVPVVNGEVEAGLAKQLFEEADIVVSEQNEHDRAMAVILSLTHFMNLAFAKVLSKENLLSLKRLAGTTFTLQLAIAESVVGENPDLVKSILRENVFTRKYLECFMSEAEAISELVDEDYGDFNNLYNVLRDSLSRDPDYSKSDMRRYKAFNALRQ